MAEYTYQQAYQRAVSTNTLYANNQARWQFYLDSYTGGEDFKKGAYLARYQLETDQEYNRRVANTPLDNQCKSLISLYISFLFRDEPQRDWDAFEINPTLQAILEDADLDGRSMNAFMKDVAIWSSVFGHAWVCVAKPQTDAITLADELSAGIRPYFSVYTPLSVVDWTWSRAVNGGYELTQIKVLEEVNDTITVYKEWTKDTITTTTVNTKKQEATDYIVEPNGIGRLPFVCVYAERSPVRGLGTSLITDIADQQLMIANELSEIYDSIRLDSHPSVVATADTNIGGASAGQVITVPENMDPNLKPYVLQFQGGQISSIYESINNRRKMIDGMGNVGAVRATETREMSGIAIQTEFQLLNARLSSIADNLELAEEQIWQEVCAYLGLEWDGEINYPGNFALHNIDNELDQLAKMKALSGRPEVQAEVDKRIAEILDIEMLENEQAPPQSLAEAQAELAGEESINGCPVAIMDKATNIANHLICIDEANLGPAKPSTPGVFWIERATRLGITPEVSVTQKCSNCSKYMNTTPIQACFASSKAAGTLPLATEVNSEWENTTDGAAYCLQWDITCSASRTCDTWTAGGPIVDNWQGPNA